MTANFEALARERLFLMAEKDHRVLTNEERERLKAISTLLGESVPTDMTLDEMAARIRATEQDEVKTPAPRAPARMTAEPPRAPSSTVVDVFSERVALVLHRLEDLGFGPRGKLAGTVGARGRDIYHEAAELKTIFDGFSAARRCGFHSVTMSQGERRALYLRVGELEKKRDEFLAELKGVDT